MRILVLIGGFLFALLAAAFFLSASRDGAAPELQSLEQTLGRPIVLYIDGAVSPHIGAALLALDAPTGALATQAPVRTLMDLDVYVMLRDSWEDYRRLENHDFAPLIRQRAQGKAADAGMAWFQATQTDSTGATRDVLIVLAARNGLVGVSDFCLALTIYELARFSGNGPAFLEAREGQGSRWKQCKARGWTRVDDLEAAAR